MRISLLRLRCRKLQVALEGFPSYGYLSFS